MGGVGGFVFGLATGAALAWLALSCMRVLAEHDRKMAQINYRHGRRMLRMAKDFNARGHEAYDRARELYRRVSDD